jgi:RHS repeat-associated protein
MVIRSSGGQQAVWMNGAPAGTIRHTNNYSAYVSPYLVSKSSTYTKHYYIGRDRIASKLGHGQFYNISFPQQGLSAGNVDYVARAGAMEQAQANFYASLGVSPGPPTDKNYYAEPQNSGIPAPVFVDSTANNVPQGWPADTLTPPNGPPVYLPSIPSNDSVKAGYGFVDAGQFPETDQYFFHPDLTGSTVYITDGQGAVSQHVEYSPLGETFVETHTGSYVTPYLFHARERDEQTGYYAYGARFYDPMLSQWLTVLDPTGDDFPLDGAGYGSLTGTDDDDEAQSSPFMNPAFVVGTGLNPADNARDGRGKTEKSRELKVQAKKSREPLNRKWQERFARWFPKYHEEPVRRHSVAVVRQASASVLVPNELVRRASGESVGPPGVSQERGSVAGRESVSFIEIEDRGSIGNAGGGSIGSIEEANRGSVSVGGNGRRRSSSVILPMNLVGRPGGVRPPARPRGGSFSQGGNGSR